MKSTVEKLSPTRVRINVEVPFAELEPDIDKAFKQLAKQNGGVYRATSGGGGGKKAGKGKNAN